MNGVNYAVALGVSSQRFPVTTKTTDANGLAAAPSPWLHARRRCSSKKWIRTGHVSGRRERIPHRTLSKLPQQLRNRAELAVIDDDAQPTADRLNRGRKRIGQRIGSSNDHRIGMQVAERAIEPQWVDD